MSPTRKQRAEICPGISRTGLVLLDSSLRATALDHGATTILADCNGQNGSDDSAPHIPKQVAETIRGHNWTSISGSCVTLPGLHATYRCTIYKVDPPGQGSGPDSPVLALHLQRGISPDDSINHIAKSCNLTDRELEVLRGLSIGMTSKEIAARMSISPNTVKSYIRLIMVKIGVTTRSGIVGKLLEHAARSSY